MKTTGILAALLALVAPAAAAQSVGGKVLEDSTRVPVSGAIVSAVRPGGEQVGQVLTDSVGGFVLALGKAGPILLRVTHPNYRTVRSDTLVVDEDEVVTVELRVARQVIPIEPLVVTARTDRRLQGFRERVARGYPFGHFVTRAQIERHPGATPTELLRGMPGVRLIDIPPCPGCVAQNMVFMRGGADRCVAIVLIDGMEVKQGPGFPLDAMVSADMLEGVEVYPNAGTVPAQLGVFTSSCGVVAFWTKTPEGRKLTWTRIGVVAGILAVFFLVFR